MNKNQYDAFCDSYIPPEDDDTREWDDDNVRRINLPFIIGTGGATAQVRQAGLDNSHVHELVESITAHGQKVPVTVEDVGKRPDGTTQYRLVDGEHRFRAIMRLHESEKKVKKGRKKIKYGHIRAYVRTFKDDWSRLQYQSKSNNHGLPSKDNSASDSALMLANVIQGNIPGLPPDLASLKGSESKYLSAPDAYLKELQGALKYLYPDMSPQQRKTVSTKFVKSIPGKLKNYSASDAKSDFSVWANSMGMFLTPPVHIHTVKNQNYIDWQLVARTYATKDDAKGKCENIVVMYWSDTEGKDHSALDIHRRDMINKINKRNSSCMLKKGYRLVDRLFVAPQKQNSSNDEKGFYEVKMDQNGNFPSTAVPTSGWNTVPKKKVA